MNYEGILKFKGTWRNYQARVLEHADRKIEIRVDKPQGRTYNLPWS